MNKFDLQSHGVLESIEAGASVADAARDHAVSPRTVERWLERGRKAEHGPYRDFAEAVDNIREGRKLEGLVETLEPEELAVRPLVKPNLLDELAQRGLDRQIDELAARRR